MPRSKCVAVERKLSAYGGTLAAVCLPGWRRVKAAEGSRRGFCCSFLNSCVVSRHSRSLSALAYLVMGDADIFDDVAEVPRSMTMSGILDTRGRGEARRARRREKRSFRRVRLKGGPNTPRFQSIKPHGGTTPSHPSHLSRHLVDPVAVLRLVGLKTFGAEGGGEIIPRLVGEDF